MRGTYIAAKQYGGYDSSNRGYIQFEEFLQF